MLIMRRCWRHPVTAWAALVAYVAVGVVLPASAVYCQQDDGDVAVMWGGGCASTMVCSESDHEHFISVPDWCDSPCVDTPISPDTCDAPRRSVDLDTRSFGEVASVVVADAYSPRPPRVETHSIHGDSPPPSLLPVRSVVLLI